MFARRNVWQFLDICLPAAFCIGRLTIEQSSLTLQITNHVRLHLIRRFDSQQIQRAYQLPLDQFRQSHQKRALLFVRLGQNVMAVIKIAECLRQLERVFRHKRRLLRANRSVRGGVQRPAMQQQFPQIRAIGCIY